MRQLLAELPSAPGNTGAMHDAGAVLSTGRGQQQHPTSLSKSLGPMLGTSEGQQQRHAPEIDPACLGSF